MRQVFFIKNDMDRKLKEFLPADIHIHCTVKYKMRISFWIEIISTFFGPFIEEMKFNISRVK